MDARKSRYADWAELIGYCSLSAMPVGRFVLDVHGEDPATTWPASDAICAALQVINHLQDCGKDYRALDRVYLPLDRLHAHGAAVADLVEPRSSPGLKACIAELAERSQGLLDEGRILPELVADTRAAMEIAAIHRLAEVIASGLKKRDPLCEKVHMGKAGFAVTALAASAGILLRRSFRAPRKTTAPFFTSPSGLTRGPKRYRDPAVLGPQVSLRSPEDDGQERGAS
jgi:phytoene/squalene synthetase